MRIAIDMQGAQTESRFRGIGRYTMSFAQAVVRNRGEHEIILALSGLFPDTIEPIRAAFEGLLPQENIRVWHTPGPVNQEQSGNDWRRETAELIREAFLASLQLDVIHISSLFEGYVDDAVTSIGKFDTQTPVSVILYDLIPLLNPEHYLKPNPPYEHYYLNKVAHLRRASQYLAISDFSRKEGIKALNVSGDSVVNISTAIDGHFQPQTIDAATVNQLKQKYGITRPFVLYTGGADERKNLPRLIQAYAALPTPLHTGHQLLLAGKMTQGDVARLQHQAKSAGLKPDELLFTGYVSDEELAQLYNLCQLYVFPSWHEGFGLPALEAMACGAPVIGANTRSLPEVIGLVEALFDPLDVKAIAAKLQQALTDEAFRIRLVEHGLEQARKFAWDNTAKRAIKAWNKLSKTKFSCPESVATTNLLSRLIQAIAATIPTNLSDTELATTAFALNRIKTEVTPKQLLIDISELAQRDARTGVQRVTRSILKELLEHPPKGYVVKPVYATQISTGYYYANKYVSSLCNVENGIVDAPIDYQPGDIFLGLDLQHHVVAAQQSFLAALRREGVCVYFVVYDLLPVLLPSAFPPGADSGHQAWLEVLTGFDGVVCISEAVAKEFEVWSRTHRPNSLLPFKIDYFHLGADIENTLPTCGIPDTATQLFAELKCRPTFLTVGTVEPRKGQVQVLNAFEHLWQSGAHINLVIVGKPGWLVDQLVKRLRTHPELGKRLFWLEGISDEYLEKAYAASTCLIAASYGEGFGLPLIEAAQHKLPIIARDIPVFREVAGEYAFYFDGKEPHQLAESIKEWIGLYENDRHPKSDNMPWLTWKESAQHLLNAILPEKRTGL